MPACIHVNLAMNTGKVLNLVCHPWLLFTPGTYMLWDLRDKGNCTSNCIANCITCRLTTFSLLLPCWPNSSIPSSIFLLNSVCYTWLLFTPGTAIPWDLRNKGKWTSNGIAKPNLRLTHMQVDYFLSPITMLTQLLHPILHTPFEVLHMTSVHPWKRYAVESEGQG